MARTYLIVAGEISGDQHAAALMHHFNEAYPATQFIGLGGNAMTAEGMRPIHHVRKLAVTGFVEVIKHLPFFRRVMKDVIDACKEERPDAAILIDYPGFNIRLGMRLKRMGIPVYYYISPQVWAWKENRVKKMKQFIRRMFAIFPFEEDYYEDKGIPTTFVGHPILDEPFDIPSRETYLGSCGIDLERPVVGLLPGSRENEILRHTGPMLDAVDSTLEENPDVQFLLAGVSGVPRSSYDKFREREAINIRIDEAHQVMQHVDLAVTSSGTATLELAYMGTPMIVIYRLAPISYLIGKSLVKINYISMPNLILDERIVPELIQGQATGDGISSWILSLLEDERLAARIKGRLAEVKARLGIPGGPERVVKHILSDLRDSYGA